MAAPPHHVMEIALRGAGPGTGIACDIAVLAGEDSLWRRTRIIREQAKKAYMDFATQAFVVQYTEMKLGMFMTLPRLHIHGARPPSDTVLVIYDYLAARHVHVPIPLCVRTLYHTCKTSQHYALKERVRSSPGSSSRRAVAGALESEALRLAAWTAKLERMQGCLERLTDRMIERAEITMTGMDFDPFDLADHASFHVSAWPVPAG